MDAGQRPGARRAQRRPENAHRQHHQDPDGNWQAIEEGDLHDSVKVSREAAYTEGSAMYLTEGETLTLETLLYGLLLCSGNDAAVAVAQHVGGSVKGFVALMKRKSPGAGDGAFLLRQPQRSG